jgi:hypothetical protein
VTFSSTSGSSSSGSPGSDQPGANAPAAWIEAFSTLVKDGRLRRLELHRVDGRPVRESAAAADLAAAGFVPTLKGLALHG